MAWALSFNDGDYVLRVEMQEREIPKFGVAVDVSDLFGRPHVYLLMRKNDVVYVGQSKTLSTRVADHRKSEKDFDKIRAIPVTLENMSRIEAALIRCLKPEYNRALVDRDADDDEKELVRDLGFIVREKALFETKAFEPGSYGLVSVDGKVGYYDDDDNECECSEAYEQLHLEIEDCSNETIEAICKKSGCQKLAIIYFGEWESGYEEVEHENVLHLADPGDEMKGEVLSRLLAHVAPENRATAAETMRF